MTWSDPVVLDLCARHEASDPVLLIRELCQALLQQCPTETGQSPLGVLGSCRGVRDTRYEMFDRNAECSSLLVPVDGGYEIVVNAAHPPERQHFSRAHEIVHTFFREIRPYANASDEEETLCDIGAAELTMPTARFGGFLAQAGVSFPGLYACCSEFGVSFRAAMRRATELTDEAACQLVGAMGRTKEQDLKDVGEPRLRIQHWNQSKSWPESRGYLNLPVLNASLIHDAFMHQDERVGNGELGLTFRPGIFRIEALGVSYAKDNNPLHREVIALVRLCA